MDIIDLTTLRLSIVLTSVVCALILIIVWRINRELPGVLQWLVGVSLNSVAFLSGVVSSLGLIPASLFVVISNTLSHTAMVFMLEGCLRFRGRESSERWKLIFVLLPVFILLPILSIDDTARRYLVHDALAILLLLAAATIMVWHTSREEFRVYAFSSLFSALLAMAFLYRLLVNLGNGQAFASSSPQVNTVLYVCVLLYVLGWTYTLIAACYFKAHSNILQLAREDSLTGLPNRRSIDETLQRTLLQAERHRQPFALVMLDLNRFKDINDNLGHAFGDALLRELGRRLQYFLRGADFAGRLGGDEFLLILNDIKDNDSGHRAINRLRQAVSGQLVLNDEVLSIDLSMGLALWPRDGEDADSLLGKADRNMYRDKERRRQARTDEQGEQS